MLYLLFTTVLNLHSSIGYYDIVILAFSPDLDTVVTRTYTYAPKLAVSYSYQHI